MTDRIACCIPGCGRTYKREDAGEGTIMCGRHWRMGDERLRARHKQLRKRVRWFERKDRFGHKVSKRPKFGESWYRASLVDHFAWVRIQNDVEIKAALGAEDAPRRRPRVDA